MGATRQFERSIARDQEARHRTTSSISKASSFVHDDDYADELSESFTQRTGSLSSELSSSSINQMSSYSSSSSSLRKSSSFLKQSPKTSNKQPHSNNFRSKYFIKLGVLGGPINASRFQSNHFRAHSDPLPMAGSASPEVLKTDGGMCDSSLTLHSSPVLSPAAAAKRKVLRTNNKGRTTSNGGSVCFQPQVQVRPVPGRQDLPEPIKESLWMSMPEFVTGLERNTLEFASEGFSWQDAKEEDQFLFWNGEFIHPALYYHHHAYYYSHNGGAAPPLMAAVPVVAPTSQQTTPPAASRTTTSPTCCDLKRPFLLYMLSSQQQQEQSHPLPGAATTTLQEPSLDPGVFKCLIVQHFRSIY